jgi:hypothetical protein
MTVRDFLSKLTASERGEVTISEGITLTSAPFYGLMPNVLADSLEALLLDTDEIHSGWQVATMGDESSKHEWLLIVGDSVILVRVTPNESQRGCLDVGVRDLSLAASAPDLRLSFFADTFRGGNGQLIDGDISVAAGGETFKITMARSRREPFKEVCRELRAAIGRARRAR